MNIDLIEAEQAIEKLKAELGLSRRASCVNVELWSHASEGRKLSIRVSIFDHDNECQGANGTTWQAALEAVRLELIGQGSDPRDQPITVEVEP